MITRERLRNLHDQDLPLHVLEQDYIQALFLQKLYKETDYLVFKGGTFLKHAYGLDRFSEDLDFTQVNKSKEALKVIKKSAQKLSDYGIEAEVDQIQKYEEGLSCRLRYSGPLYNGSERSKGSIEIDVSKRDDVVLETEWTRLFFQYPEIRVVNALALQKKELLAEKLRALSTRNKARDLYDCWYLMNQGAQPDFHLFKQKMDNVGSKPEVQISTTEESWENDLEIFLEKPPEFEKVKNHVISNLKQKDFEINSNPAEKDTK